MEIIKRQLRKIKPLVRLYRKLTGSDELVQVAGMTSLDERQYYQRFGSEGFSGEGAIVDLGCWFGSTTLALARGLKVNAKVADTSKKIYAYDQFLWEDWMAPFTIGTKWDGRFKTGDSFMVAFEDIVQRYKKIIVTRQADLTREKWEDGPIEYLLVDAMKTWQLLNAIQRNFYPALIPGKATVLHQDFCHFHTYWIHLLNYRLREFFEPVDGRSFGSSVSFRLLKAIPAELLAKDYSVADFTDAEVEAAFEYSLGVVLPVEQGAVMAAKIMCCRDRKGNEAARLLLAGVRADGFLHHDLETVSGILGQ